MTDPSTSSKPTQGDKTLDDLSWQQVVDAVAARCRGPLGVRCVVPIATTIEGARIASAETAECLQLCARGEALPLEGFSEVGPHLLRVLRGGVLDVVALLDVLRLVGAARSLRRFLHARREQATHLIQACPLDPSLDRLHEELSPSLRSDGTLDDRASPMLQKLRAETSNLRGRIVRRLESMLLKHEAILQDRFHTLREGRYVIPVRRDAHEKLPGIVHGTSASGATVFVEPRGLVEQGNRLKMAEGELAREEARILAELTELVRERHASLRAAADAMDHADLRQASAQLGVDQGGHMLPIDDDARIELHQARHPVLLLDGVEVVPNDLALRQGEGIVFSGPNAGGKTVALKTLGLAALMTRAGLPFPAGPESRSGFFANVHTDVGDEQSLQTNLSTFSAHITNIARILADVSRGRGASLVLLDELAGGTDPEEGAALACAVVDALCRAGAAVAVTTHYEPLKAMAGGDARLQNAAVGFDVEAMAPTFELTLGVPGASSALDVAQRFGISKEIIETARAVLPERTRSVDALVQELETARRTLAIDRAKLDDETQRLAKERQVVRAREEAAARKRRDELDEEAGKLRSALRQAREDVRLARRLLKQKADAKTAEGVKRRIDEAAKVAARHPEKRPELPSGTPAQPEDLVPGVKVWVPKLRAEAEVLEMPRRKSVRVAAGALRLWVDVSGLLLRDADPKPAPKPPKPDPVRGPARAQAPDNTLDVRGLRVDDALGMTTSFLDRMFGASESVAYILHGVGTGALRDAIRTLLGEQSNYVRSYRTGTSEEGGERLTVVTLT